MNNKGGCVINNFDVWFFIGKKYSVIEAVVYNRRCDHFTVLVNSGKFDRLVEEVKMI